MFMFRTLAKMPFLSQLRLSPSTEETDDQGGVAGGDYDDLMIWWGSWFCNFDYDDFHDQGGAAGGDYDDRWWFGRDHDFVIFMMTIFTNKGACDPCWLVAYIF